MAAVLFFLRIFTAVGHRFGKRFPRERLDFSVCVPQGDGRHHLSFHIQPFFQFVISKENIACPQRPDIPRRRFQAHILDRRTHRLDVRHFHQMLIYGKFAVVVLPLAVDKEDDDRRLFQHAGRINRGGDIFFIPFSENGRFIAPVPFDSCLLYTSPSPRDTR